MTISELHKKYRHLPKHEFELLVAYHLKTDRLWVLTHPEYQIPAKLLLKAYKDLDRLTQNIPLAQIISLKRFYDVDFIVNKHVLIPRQESEELIDLVASDIKSHDKFSKIADIGTGSGCIGLILAKKFPQKKLFLIDNSKNALRVARQNTDRLNLDVKILFGNLLLPLKKSLPDLIVANLPYLSRKIYAQSPVSVRKFEPKSALYGGSDGLDPYRRLFKQIKKYYRKKFPSIWLEISPEQVKKLQTEVNKIFPKAKTKFLKDLSKRFRFAHISGDDVDDNKD